MTWRVRIYWVFGLLAFFGGAATLVQIVAGRGGSPLTFAFYTALGLVLLHKVADRQ